ncbi:hypothetical protein FHS61_000982 [Altererythrobacter atlanticus]|uniref:Uncharacterized protein n=1 Tax=Croceibacterium atlanticum TaxID=1267766 RepID=A0A0F7KVW0_9SPHN|nr:DUF2497 domain-containing protein [Croceibacterium atlanticum]AKH43316.1 hypothetical protein WYH_02284 [Croceibacterium atlanticum]MBB5731978.1 hypothetical protein [Croceibacterium atlanticum]
MRQEGEPSVEEILDSIKKVIARDNRESAAAERRHRETSGIAQQEEHSAGSQDESEEVLDLEEAAEMLGEEDFAEHASSDSEDADAAAEALMNAGATSSIRESLAALATIAEPGAPPQIVRSGETSLEAMAREMLRPMLAQWLDQNLPPIVERMVKDEITRIVRKKS